MKGPWQLCNSICIPFFILISSVFVYQTISTWLITFCIIWQKFPLESQAKSLTERHTAKSSKQRVPYPHYLWTDKHSRPLLLGLVLNPWACNELKPISHSSTFPITKKINCTLFKKLEITICCSNYWLHGITWLSQSLRIFRLMMNSPQRQNVSISSIFLSEPRFQWIHV